MSGIKSDKSFYRSDSVGTDAGVNTTHNTSNTLPEFTVFNPKWTLRAINIVDSSTTKSQTNPVSATTATRQSQSRLTGKKLVLNPKYSRYSQAKYVYDRLTEQVNPKTGKEGAYKLPHDVAMLLTLQAGAESGYNPAPQKPYATGGGIGGWIGKNREKVLNYVNGKYGTAYNRIDDIPLDEQIDALQWFYYSGNEEQKSFVNGHLDDVAILSKYGFSPAIIKYGKWTGTNPKQKTYGQTYYNTPEGWTAYMNDTGNNPNKRWATYEDSILARINNAGMILQ